MNTLNSQVKNLIKSQLQTWDLAAKNYAGLASVITRELAFDGFKMSLQFNPERMRSSAAKVDAQSIRERKCFLCLHNLPEQQEGVDFMDKYSILVNPFPIFNQHLTIPDKRHVDQLFEGRMDDMLMLAKLLPDFIVFYNGPKCGASAPDHFHFQAGNKGFLPLENDFHFFKRKKLLKEHYYGNIFTMENYLRQVIIFESSEPRWINNEFEALMSSLREIQPDEPEPLMNIVVNYFEYHWQVYVFPRAKHRPSHFFEEGDKQILFSPGAVDFGGTLIFPRKEDFEKVDQKIIQEMFGELTLTEGITQRHEDTKKY